MSSAPSELARDAVGIGLRAEHQRRILEERPPVPFFELLIDNHIAADGPVFGAVAAICERSPVSFHSTCFSLGSVDALHWDYLGSIRLLVERFRPTVLSDHLCWSGVDGVQGHDLFPLPMTEAVVAHVADRIRAVQDFFGRRIAIENVSAYLRSGQDGMPEGAFLAEVAEAADCEILLDVNNIYVNARNFGDDAEGFLAYVPGERIVQYHLGGHTDLGTHVIDSHSAPVVEAVEALFSTTLARFGARPTIIEWDKDLPSLEVLLEERDRAEALVQAAAMVGRNP